MKIEITEQAKKEAKEYHKKMIGFVSYLGNNYTGIHQKDRFEIGYLGEWVFNEFLKNNCVKEIEWVGVQSDGNSHDFEFGSKKIDVKTASREFYKRIMMPLSQFQKYHRDYYVAVKLNDARTQGEIMGYLRHEDLKNIKSEDFGHGETIAVFFSKMRPIKDLIEQEVLLKWDQVQ